MDAKTILEQYQDHLAPKLDTYEQAIYLYLLRHSRLQALDEIVVGFKSARRRMAFGIGSEGTPMSEGTCYKKLKSLANKGCIVLSASEREGMRLRLLLPSEIDGIIKRPVVQAELALEDMNFFGDPENRSAILAREGNRCFYCLRALDASNYVIEHVTSRPNGDDSYRNVVAACRQCNNRKGDSPAEEFVRGLYRSGFLEAGEFEERVTAISRLRAGELRPTLEARS
jgi:hypothetical protein